jgi:hypothetical protein
MIKNNSLNYPDHLNQLELDEQKFQLFPAKVLSIDYERKICTLQDERTLICYSEVRLFPANSSSVESSDVHMPEEGSHCLAVHLYFRSGFSKVAIVNWLLADVNAAIDAVASRAIVGIDGWNKRKRGLYRKAYPGQKTTSLRAGYSERQAGGWDRIASDLSREKIDEHRRARLSTTSQTVSYTDAGISVSGVVERPEATGIKPSVLPDGSSKYTVFLDPNASLEDRYLNGKPDVIAFSEKLERIQEFAIDYPIPLEILQSSLLNDTLGVVEDPWERTETIITGQISHDDQSMLAEQSWDHPSAILDSDVAVGPTLNEGITPRRRGYIIERSEGTLVGYSQFDSTTYGKVLKSVLFPNTSQGRFGSNVDSGYLPVVESPNHTEARLAASVYSLRFPYEYNTTKLDITKEGMALFELGATLPKENIGLSEGYEHPHGAGRSLEGHLVGSAKLVIGKNRDEEDSVDLQALGQVVLRIGADDGSLPDFGRSVFIQERGKNDSLQKRKLQYWSGPKLKPGDAVNLENKTGAENISIRLATDGGMACRVGARDPSSKRRHLVNGYSDGQGKINVAVNDASRRDSKSAGRPTYGAGDNLYAFHDLTQAGNTQTGFLPYSWSGSPVEDMDSHGLSLDFHAVRDILLRVGANEASGQSLLLDLAGGIAAWLGKDNSGRSVTCTLDGGVEAVIGRNNEKKSLRLEIQGDVDWVIKGNWQVNCTGDIIFDSASYRLNSKTDLITTAQRQVHMGLVRHTTEAPDIVHSQGDYLSDQDT